MTVNAINGKLLSGVSKINGITLASLSAINGQTIASGPASAVVGQSKLYTGNGTSQSITGADFSPDLVIVRRRDGFSGTQWRWTDNVRGAGLDVFSSTNGAESSNATGVTSFDANGFSVGNSTGQNDNTRNYLAVLLQRVAAAFDIVLYTGTGSAQTIAHGLGVVPELIIVKNRIFARNWKVYAAALGNTKALTLDSSNAADTSATYWNNTSPTSAVFTVNSSTLVNESTRNFVAYLFASVNPGVKIGSYTGDGNTNGPFQTTNFRPRILIVKRTDAAGDWMIFEDQIDSTSPHNTYNRIDVGGANAEEVCTNSAGGVDFTSTGWQSIDSNGTNCAINVNTATYVYIAIA